MKYTSSLKAACMLAISMTFGTAMAAENATTAMQRVEVAGQKAADIARLDVDSACPGIAQSLKASLLPIWSRNQEPARVRVQFRVQGDQVTTVSARGGPEVYRQPIRRAVSDLACSDKSGDAQLYAFELKFTPEGEAKVADQVVAMLTK